MSFPPDAMPAIVPLWSVIRPSFPFPLSLLSVSCFEYCESYCHAKVEGKLRRLHLPSEKVESVQ